MKNQSVPKKIKKQRQDRNGMEIVKHGRKHKVTFADSVLNSNVKLKTIYKVESYKKYNSMWEEAKTKISCSCVIF